MKPITRALHSRIDDTDALSSVTPLYQCSAFEAGSPYFYTRKNNPNIAEFEMVIAALEGARHAVAMTTGMAAISAVLQLLRPGETMVVNKDIYGCSYKLFQRFADHWGLKLKILDLSVAENLPAMPPETRMVIFETPTNPFLKTVDIEAVSRAVKRGNPNALVVVDNTWATPLYQHPLELGADISLHSATKYFSGHSDVMGGIILTDRDELQEELRNTRFYGGAILDPHSAWLLRRSMQTFAMRMNHHYRIGAEVRDFLATQPQVARVYYPQIDGRQLKGYGGLIFFELRPDLVRHYTLFSKTLELFNTGTGMACVTSMVAQPYTGSHASMTAEEKQEMGLDHGLVRLSLGLEDPADLKADLANAFALIERESAPAAVEREAVMSAAADS
ncbi:MAG TPA: PLP-dependent transferase [Pyrinomonadaceae bacterium]|jgi:cystathionine beta-lyase/cystathionine gamma-synthase